MEVVDRTTDLLINLATMIYLFKTISNDSLFF